MATRYVVTNSLGSGPPKWKTDLGTFTVGMADLFLDEYFLENVWEVKVSRRLYKVKVVYSACYTLYGIIQLLLSTSSSLGEILSIPLSGSTTYILINHGNISFDKKKTNGEEEWNEIKDIAASIWHLCYKI
ncbi:hypothetical protein MTR67_007924 [Solanum verrucosum]|uniref:Uncharacterized protein n=1 Tax=Solanum verrucosum TaxID=315347 RepID=A0AAF0Q702_SOLVR|nr:hypothetical protein MTR67_007924 [Solanum verrucosum]